MQQPNIIDLLAGIVASLSGNTTVRMASSYNGNEYEATESIVEAGYCGPILSQQAAFCIPLLPKQSAAVSVLLWEGAPVSP